MTIIHKEGDATPTRMKEELQLLADRLGIASLADALYFPKFVQIETTRLCNAHCPFCPVDIWDKSTPFMSDKLFKKIADEVIQYRDWIRWVNVQKAGEPLLDKKIYDRIAYLKTGGIKHVTMATNASGLTEKNARRLLEAGIDDLMLSIDAVNKEDYEKTRVGLDFEPVIANIRGFFRLRDELRPEAIIRVRGVSLYDEDNEEHLKRIAEWHQFWEPLRKPHDRIYFKRAHNWGNQMDIKEADKYGWVYHPCIMPWSTIQVSAMGTVILCPQDYDGVIDIGDVNEHSIVEVWRGKALEEIRRLHAEGKRNDIKLCQGCTVYDQEFSMENDEKLKRKVSAVSLQATGTAAE